MMRSVESGFSRTSGASYNRSFDRVSVLRRALRGSLAAPESRVRTGGDCVACRRHRLQHRPLRDCRRAAVQAASRFTAVAAGRRVYHGLNRRRTVQHLLISRLSRSQIAERSVRRHGRVFADVRRVESRRSVAAGDGRSGHRQLFPDARRGGVPRAHDSS